VQAEAGFRQVPWSRMLGIAALVMAALFFLLSLTAYVTDLATHRGVLLSWYDLNVYNDSGLITRQLPSILYSWQYAAGVKFTYTPFAAIVFAGGTFIPWDALRWAMTVVSLISVPLTAWLTLGAMGHQGTRRASAALGVSALALWIEPVGKALQLGQIEPLLLLLVVWDLTRDDKRWWKGAGIGIAAGIKLIPLIFIPFLLAAGKVRQAAVATATFAASVVVGFIVLPGPSASYWLTGYFFRPGRTGSVVSLVNQSLLGFIARQEGGPQQAQSTWLPVALGVLLVGIAGGAILSRSGRPVQGWVLVGITSVLVSPISWDHHWVWLVPFLAMLAGLAMTTRGAGRWALWTTMVLTAAAVGSWPWRWSGPEAFMPGRGMLGWFVQPPEIGQPTILGTHGWALLTWNLWIAVGSAIYLGMLASVLPSWRRRPRRVAVGPRAPSDVGALLSPYSTAPPQDDPPTRADPLPDADNSVIDRLALGIFGRH
jgi:Glycosyltransferase family 87